MKTTKAAFKRFAKNGLQYQGSSSLPVEKLVALAEPQTPNPELRRDPVTIRSADLIRHKEDGGKSFLNLTSVTEVLIVSGFWLLITRWKTNLGEDRQNTVIYS